MNSDFYFLWLTECAQELVAAEKHGGPLDPKFYLPGKGSMCYMHGAYPPPEESTSMLGV